MSAKKFHNLFKKSEASPKSEASLKERSMNTQNSSQPKTDTKVTNTQDKATVESLKSAINAKLKDPAMAKKAAQIITDLLGKK